MQTGTIGFIGGGNMAASLVGGLLAAGTAPAQVQVSEPDDARREALVQRFSIVPAADNPALAGSVEALVLAVKPQQMQAVCRQIAATVQQWRPLIVSIAAGVPLAALQDWLGGDLPVVRTMPNTPALLQCGVTGMYASADVSPAQRDLADAVMRAAGQTVWLDDEGQMDAVTALSGSGPAYFFLLLEAMQQAGEKLGLTAGMARQLSQQTALGAARMALESPDDPATLRRQVTSPGGTTERAIGIFQQGGFMELVEQALTGARDRSRELAADIGK